jgi:hypothetical protein
MVRILPNIRTFPFKFNGNDVCPSFTVVDYLHNQWTQSGNQTLADLHLLEDLLHLSCIPFRLRTPADLETPTAQNLIYCAENILRHILGNSPGLNSRPCIKLYYDTGDIETIVIT